MVRARGRCALGLALVVAACGGAGGEREGGRESGLRAAFPGRDPALSWDGAGSVHVLYIEEGPDGASLTYRRLGADPAGPVAVSPPGLKVSAHGEVPPSLALLPDGALLAAYPAALPGRWKNEIRVQRSGDGGATWERPVLLHPARHGAHSYLSAAATPAGGAVFAWLDDRTGHMGLSTASTRDGRAFSAARTLDPRTCECCGTALLAGSDGALRLAYRGLAAGDVRDIRLLRTDETGAPLGPAAEVSADGWELQGCPHTGPRLAADRDGGLWAAWFTAGGGTDRVGVYAAVSQDGGASFGPREAVAVSSFVKHPEIGVLPDGRVAVLYEAIRPGGGHPIAFRLRDPGNGSWSAEKEGPPGVYPRLAVAPARAEGTAVAFTCRAGEGTQVVVAGWNLFADGDAGWAGCHAAAAPAHGRHGGASHHP